MIIWRAGHIIEYPYGGPPADGRCLPLEVLAGNQRAAETERPKEASVDAKTRILLADSDLDSRLVYRIMLEHRGYEVVEADNGETAITLAYAGGVTIVVTELTLRIVDGHAVLERLRADERTRDVRVVVLTARGLEEDRVRAEQNGCTLFLTKPLEPNVLADEIDRLLR